MQNTVATLSQELEAKKGDKSPDVIHSESPDIESCHLALCSPCFGTGCEVGRTPFAAAEGREREVGTIYATFMASSDVSFPCFRERLVMVIESCQKDGTLHGLSLVSFKLRPLKLPLICSLVSFLSSPSLPHISQTAAALTGRDIHMDMSSWEKASKESSENLEHFTKIIDQVMSDFEQGIAELQVLVKLTWQALVVWCMLVCLLLRTSTNTSSKSSQ